VAEQVDGLGHANVVVLPGEQVADVGASLRDAEHARFVLNEDEVGAALAIPRPATSACSSTRKVYETPCRP
jgi:hypothetical protein